MLLSRYDPTTTFRPSAGNCIIPLSLREFQSLTRYSFRGKCRMANGNPEPEDKKLILKKPALKPYVKPTFRVERVFETQALTCGKINTQNQCHINRKTS